MFMLCSNCVYGHKGNKIKRIEMQIEVQENGNAKITEVWYMNIFDGYVYYKFYKNVKNNEIQNLTVTDENGFAYQYSDDWNLSDEEKKDKCGVLYTNDGAAILWGIQSYGAHQYTLNYEVKNFVKNFNDYKGAKFDFLDEGNPALTYVKINSDVCKFTKQNTQIKIPNSLDNHKTLCHGCLLSTKRLTLVFQHSSTSMELSSSSLNWLKSLLPSD